MRDSMLLFEHPSILAVWNAKLPILYAGALSCGAGYTLQIIGQRDYDPTISIIAVEPGIRVQRFSWMASYGRNFKWPGTVWMCAGICSGES